MALRSQACPTFTDLHTLLFRAFTGVIRGQRVYTDPTLRRTERDDEEDPVGGPADYPADRGMMIMIARE
ncbi:hypothetical protein Tco_1564169 [Tanacetum coccineum]